MAAVAGAQSLRKTGQGDLTSGGKYAMAGAAAGVGAGALFKAAGSRASRARGLMDMAGQLRGLRVGPKAIAGLGIAAGAAAGGYAMYKHGTSVFAGAGG